MQGSETGGTLGRGAWEPGHGIAPCYSPEKAGVWAVGVGAPTPPVQESVGSTCVLASNEEAARTGLSRLSCGQARVGRHSFLPHARLWGLPGPLGTLVRLGGGYDTVGGSVLAAPHPRGVATCGHITSVLRPYGRSEEPPNPGRLFLGAAAAGAWAGVQGVGTLS